MYPYIVEKTSKEVASHLRGQIVNQQYILYYKDNAIVNLNVFDFNQMVFGQTSEMTSRFENEAKTICEQLFPIPFIWPNNLNYQ